MFPDIFVFLISMRQEYVSSERVAGVRGQYTLGPDLRRNFR